MKKALNLQCPYSVFLDTDTFIYSFNTKNQIEYNVLFASMSALFDDTSVGSEIKEIYTISINKLTNSNEPFDSDVGKTIDCIIGNFFVDKEKSIIYLCDNTDRKQSKRNLKFERWYQQSIMKKSLTKIDRTINIDDENTHITSLIYHNENPFKSSLEQGYYEVIDTVSDKDLK